MTPSGGKREGAGRPVRGEPLTETLPPVKISVRQREAVRQIAASKKLTIGGAIRWLIDRPQRKRNARDSG